MSRDEQSINPNARKLIVATVSAFVLSVILLFAVIMPAELGRDPLGTGELLGLTALSRGQNPLEEQLIPHRSDFVEFELSPFQSVEYKYEMDIEAPLLFRWVADGELYYDMHAEPAGLGPDFAESYEAGDASEKMGAYYAPFAGIHGWFWENRAGGTITLRLYTAGFYQYSTVFRDGGSYEREIEPIVSN